MTSVRSEDAPRWAAATRRLLAIARVGAQYPEARRLDGLFQALALRSAPLTLDVRSGLPALSELAALRADQQLAEEFFHHHADRLQERVPYFRALQELSLPNPSSTDARLVARIGSGGAARLRVVHDTLDPANGCFVRLAAIVEQRAETLVTLERQDLCAPRPALSEALEGCAGADAELAFLLLASVDGVTVHEVVRGQVGPLEGGSFHLQETTPVPPPPELASAGEPVLLHLVLDRAATDVAQDVCRDPLARLYRDALAPGARAAAEARRAELGYRIAKERRFVCAPPLEAPLRAWARALKAPVVIRSR